MIIPKHKVCDICEQFVGVNKRYFIIKSKNIINWSTGSCSDNKIWHICEDCMQEVADYIQSKLEEKKNDGGNSRR